MNAPISRPVPRPGVLDIDPYVPGKSKASGAGKLFKLSSNETPLGPSPKAIAAFHAASEMLEFYPAGGATLLRTAIGRAPGLTRGSIANTASWSIRSSSARSGRRRSSRRRRTTGPTSTR